MKPIAKDKYIPLKPIIHPWIEKLLADKDLLADTVKQQCSPVNIQSVTPFAENIAEYKRVFEQYELKHKIFFARKANKCLTFAKAAAAAGEGVDTASHKELQQCLEAGIPGDQLILTAAIKNIPLIELAVEEHVTIIIDNMDEYDSLDSIVLANETTAKISLRIGGFTLDGKTLPTRFGFPLDEAYKLITEQIKKHPFLRFSGLHFHLNGYAIDQRVAAIAQSIKLIDDLAAAGISCEHLDIGGGYLVNYLAHKKEWEAFHQELKQAVLGQRPAITYQNDPLGMVLIDGKLHGEPTVYPYYNELPKAVFLEKILSSEDVSYGQPIHELIKARNIELRIEPGRSLLDQAGITVARVVFRKNDTEGNLLVGLEMNRTQMKSSSADFLLDPIHITHQSTELQEPVDGYLVGGYCLEQEFLLKRKIQFATYPKIGDLIIFPNTAGYMMHFFESQAHQFALANNVFCTADLQITKHDGD
ncbi:alanine racemase [Sphingobacterium deserti]|uniref:Putative diaminopimelate decarboxylase n=1 Tax=Sphingobacterium deserti TaxID=1229276 RepID=A0A0B8T6N6_9SPHI|nr:alanine racemase [Sphingobacterium deserti]KGE13759.1 putative diaminopimelate decarboxylase [Sphingobacterium deserti]